MAGDGTAGRAAPQIRYALSRLRSRNGHHEFEHLCREVARLRITPNVLPATGPVSAGGDQGRDFETFRSYAPEPVPGRFLASQGGLRIVFACTLQRENLAAKIKDDLRAIMDGDPVDRAYFFCEQDIPVARRHELCDWARESHGAEIEIIDGQALSELLAAEDCLWIAERYLGLAVAGHGPAGDGAVHIKAAAGQDIVNQAGRDLHVHLDRGIRRATVAGTSADAGCPYPGLAPFTVDQAEWFFGRDRLTASLLSRLNGCITEGGPVMVVAASGAGKSSLLRAGLVHKVAEGGLTAPGSKQWPQIIFTPSAHPIREAAAALARALPDSPADAATVPDPGPEDLDDLLGRVLAAAGPAARAVIVVDQFEEVLALCESEHERAAFISWLWRAADPADSGGPLALIACGLRADFYGECTRYPQILHALQDSQVLVGPMSADELRQAIRCPAEMTGADIEPGLVEVLLADLRAAHSDPTTTRDGATADYDAGRLPLLAHALQATWQMRHGSTLTVDGYRTTGGIAHAIADTAERVFARLDSPGQRQARHVFLRLVKVGGSSSEDVRRPLSHSDLTSGHDAASAVASAYIASRLLTAGRDAIQISHEELLRAWPRLRAWLDEGRASHRTRQNLEDAAADWDHARGDRSRLYHGTHLQGAAAWAHNHDHELTEAARRFLAASLRLARLTKALRRGGIAALAALALLAGTASVVAFQQRATAIRQRDLDNFNLLVADSLLVADASQKGTANPSLAARLLLTAYRMRPSRDLAARLIDTELEPLSAPFGPRNFTFSRDGRFLVNDGGHINLWRADDLARPRRLGILSLGLYACAVLSPDGRTLAAGYGYGHRSGATRLWDVTDPAHPRQISPAMPGSICPSAFSADGRTLAVRSGHGIRFWNVSDPAHPREHGPPLALGSQRTSFVSLSPDMRTATVDYLGGAIQLWDITDPARPHKIGQPITARFHPSFLYSAEFSPDARILAVSNGLGTIQLWDITDPEHPHKIGQPMATGSGEYATANGSEGTSDIAISPDSRFLAVTNGRDAIRLWDITDPAHPINLSLHLAAGSLSPLASIALGPDGIIAARYGDGAVRLWSIPLPLPQTSTSCPSESVAFSPHGDVLAIASSDGTVDLQDVTDPSRPRQLGQPLSSGHPRPAACVAISPDGHMLAAGNDDGTIQLWNITDPAHPRQLGRPLGASQGDPVSSVAFSPSGHILAASLPYGSIQMWKITPAGKAQPLSPLVFPGPDDAASSIAFAQDGRTLTANYGAGTVRIWNLARPHYPQGLIPSSADGDTFTEALRPDGRILATISDNGTIQLWDITRPARPRKLGSPLAVGNGNTASSAAFSPDGRIIASGNTDGSIQLWNVADPARPRKLGPPLTTRSNQPIQAITFSQDDHILASDSSNGTLTLLNPNVSYAITRICHTSNLTPQQWHSLFPQIPYNPPCPPQ